MDPRRQRQPSSPDGEARGDDHGFRTLVAAAVIVLAGLAAYANSFNGVFVFDDRTALAINPFIRTAWPPTEAMKAPRDTALAGRPVTSLTFAWTYALAPADAREVFAAGPTHDPTDRLRRNASTYHWVNLAIHLLAALALFGVARHTLMYNATAIACAIATIWVVHPLTTAAVTYIVQRTESLMSLFYLLTLYCSIRAANGTSKEVPYNRTWIACAIGACALGMGTKESMATAPLIVVAWDYLFLTASWREIVRRRWPLYAALAATWLILAALVASAPRSASVGVGLEGVSSWSYLVTQAGVLVHYLRLAFVPWPLAIDYEWPIAASLIDVLPYALLIVALLAGTLWGLARRRPWAFAGVWFFLILAPSSSVVPIVTEVAADHRMYLPLAAIIACSVIVVVSGFSRTTVRLKADTTIVPYTFIVVAIVVMVTLVIMTRARNEDYFSQERLYAQTIEARPANARTRSNLASVLIEQGRTKEAEPLLREAIRLKPDFADAYANLGVALVVEGRAADALPHFERALSLKPDHPDVARNYAETLASVGRVPDAVRAFRQALASRPDDAPALEGLAWVLATTQDDAVRDGRAALEFAERAVRTAGPASNTLDTLSAAYAENGRFAEAIATAEQALAAARAAGRADLTPQIAGRLELYRAGHPYREPRRE